MACRVDVRASARKREGGAHMRCMRSAAGDGATRDVALRARERVLACARNATSKWMWHCERMLTQTLERAMRHPPSRRKPRQCASVASVPPCVLTHARPRGTLLRTRRDLIARSSHEFIARSSRPLPSARPAPVRRTPASATGGFVSEAFSYASPFAYLA